jgi:hypothetical protein
MWIVAKVISFRDPPHIHERTNAVTHTPASILYGAAHIVEYNWTRSFFVDPIDGRTCALGAIESVCIGLRRHDDDDDGGHWYYAYEQIDDDKSVIREAVHLLMDRVNGITRWNDERAEDAHEVAETMRLVARQWEARHASLPVQSELGLAGGPTT